MAVQDHSERPAWRLPAIFYDAKWRGRVIQVVLVAVVALLAYEVYSNARTNLRALGQNSGFGFLGQSAGFDISQTLIAYGPTSSYGRVFFVGLLNTLLVAITGIVAATIIGFLAGIARLSSNWVLARIATVYVEVTRNLPLLFQLFFWYMAVLAALPGPRDSYSLFGMFHLNVRGLYMPKLVFEEGSTIFMIGMAVAVAAVIAIFRWGKARQEATGVRPAVYRMSLAAFFGIATLAYLISGAAVVVDVPELGGFNFRGGTRVFPEFLALFLGLSIYTGGFIAEIVRAGVLAVSRGQSEASSALGLKNSYRLRLVVIPQALRVIIPPLTSQYLNLTKNSSLAVAIGYPDLVAVFAGTTLNQTGQAIEIIAVTMTVYLMLSLLTSAFMNWYNRRIALVER